MGPDEPTPAPDPAPEGVQEPAPEEVQEPAPAIETVQASEPGSAQDPAAEPDPAQEAAEELEPRTTRSPALAAFLSFVFPGLGQAAAGATRRGLLVAIPAIVAVTVIVAAAVATLAEGGREALLDLVLRPEVIVGFVVLDVAFLVYRLAAITDAWLVARRVASAAGRRTGRIATGGLVALLLITTVAHSAVAAIGLDTEDTLAAVFQGDDAEWSIPDASFAPEVTPSPTPTPTATVTSGVTPSPTPSPSPTPTPKPVPAWAKDGRLNLLLVGSDAGAGRWLLRTDTMVVLTVDIATGHAAMFGIPRNMVNVPLPKESRKAVPNGRFPGLLNALYVYAWSHPKQFPGGDARGFRAVTGAIQELVGVKLDAFVAVDLQGFVQLVKALGGLWIRVPKTLVDERYPKVDGTGYVRVVIKAGCQKLSGTRALEYARSRHQDSDYGRMARQQAVLLALRKQLDPVAVLEKAPKLLKIAKDHLWTTVKRSDLASMADLATQVNPKAVKSILLAPPKFPEYLNTAAIKRIQYTVRHVFDGTWPKKANSTSTAKACPKP